MSFTSFTDISKAGGLVPIEYSKEIISQLTKKSVVASAFTNRIMGAHQLSVPVNDLLASASFTPEGDAITASYTSWGDAQLVAEKCAVIVTLSKETLLDGSVDFGPALANAASNAIAKAVDAAVIHGTGKPASWLASSIVSGATAASATLSLATQEGSAVNASLSDTISDLMSKVEVYGYDTNNGFILHPKMKGKLRKAKGEDGQMLWQPMTSSTPDMIWGDQLRWANSGGMDPAVALAIYGDMSKGIIGIREDMRIEVLDQASITVGADTINLAQHDMIAFKFIFRCGYQVANPVNNMESTNQYPFAVLLA